MKKLYLIFFFSILVVFSIRAQDLLIGDFENGIGGWTTWGAPLSTESNPDMVGNTSTTVALLNQTAAAWSGMVLWNDPSIITVAFEKISLDVYIENTGGKIKLQLDNSASGAANFESEVTVLANTWTTVEFNISAITAHDYKQIAFQSDVADMIYFDNIKLISIPVVIENKMIFVHPGAVNGKADLDFVKEMIAAGKQPWTKAFNQMKGMAKGGSNPMEWIDSHDDAGDAAISKDDALKTYANALTWYFTGQEIYAKQAIALLNAWTILQGFNNGTDQDKLHAGWIGSLFGPAAEIMRDYPGWAPEDIAKVQQMFRRAYYPQLKTVSTWNGNVDLAQIEALMNIAVFNEDSLEFYQGINRLRLRNPAYFYLADDLGSKRNYGGSSYPGSWSSPTRWVDGITQETCRDNNHHAQFALASAIHAAEVAWNQGIDIYTENTERYTAAMELMATQFLTGKMQGTCSDNNTTTNIFDTWEMGYYHYHHRKGLGLPNSEKMIKDIVRVKASSQLNIFYETLTHGDPSIFLTDINQLSQNTEISIFPNPSNNGLFQFNREVQWEVFNTIGIKVKEGYGNELNLSNQTKGLYLVKAENCVIKIIIN